jgi:hypothetical protein
MHYIGDIHTNTPPNRKADACRTLDPEHQHKEGATLAQRSVLLRIRGFQQVANLDGGVAVVAVLDFTAPSEECIRLVEQQNGARSCSARPRSFADSSPASPMYFRARPLQTY